MIVVGIDPSLSCTGLAISTDDSISTRRVKSAAAGTTLLAKRNRIRQVVSGILAPIPPRVDVTVIEVPNSRQQYGAQNERVALYWFLVDQLLARGPVVEVTPSQRAKLATGNGRADKAQVLAHVRAMFPDVAVLDDNVADALALAWAGLRWAGAQQPDYLPGQEQAHARLDWPSRSTTTH
ncbi:MULTISPECIES: crossover junction endodeoxyribonuclease RuvC [unclassified Microbacterium]|uniref:crossover junction endodeoxyribonuclease RuvC n=1 Tax=unclassified Microbacterium TaxID=2609290 RepID=UPI003C2BC668